MQRDGGNQLDGLEQQNNGSGDNNNNKAHFPDEVQNHLNLLGIYTLIINLLSIDDHVVHEHHEGEDGFESCDEEERPEGELEKTGDPI